MFLFYQLFLFLFRICIRAFVIGLSQTSLPFAYFYLYQELLGPCAYHACAVEEQCEVRLDQPGARYVCLPNPYYCEWDTGCSTCVQQIGKLYFLTLMSYCSFRMSQSFRIIRGVVKRVEIKSINHRGCQENTTTSSEKNCLTSWEHVQCLNGMERGVKRSKCPLLAWHLTRKCSFKTSRISVKATFGNNVINSSKVWPTQW